jgi:hypothetical protein
MRVPGGLPGEVVWGFQAHLLMGRALLGAEQGKCLLSRFDRIANVRCQTGACCEAIEGTFSERMHCGRISLALVGNVSLAFGINRRVRSKSKSCSLARARESIVALQDCH